MIWNFYCIKCRQYKSVGQPYDKDGRWICAECYKKIRELNEVKKDGRGL